jgi:hypothetical protein
MKKMRTSKCFTMEGTKMENKPFVGFASIVMVLAGNSGWLG